MEVFLFLTAGSSVFEADVSPLRAGGRPQVAIAEVGDAVVPAHLVSLLLSSIIVVASRANALGEAVFILLAHLVRLARLLQTRL